MPWRIFVKANEVDLNLSSIIYGSQAEASFVNRHISAADDWWRQIALSLEISIVWLHQTFDSFHSTVLSLTSLTDSSTFFLHNKSAPIIVWLGAAIKIANIGDFYTVGTLPSSSDQSEKNIFPFKRF